MTDTPQEEGGPEWDPFSSQDPEIKFLIATICTAAIVMTEEGMDMHGPLHTLITAATRLKEVVSERQK